MNLNTQEREVLLQILEKHLEEMDDTRECMIDDPVSFRNIETFTETMQQHEIDKMVAEGIKRKVLDDDGTASG